MVNLFKIKPLLTVLTVGFGIIALIPATISAAQNSQLSQVSLQEVLVDITKTNPSILEALEYYQGVVEERSIATSEYLPTIGTEITAGPETTKGVSTEESIEQDDGSTLIEEVRQDLTTTTATLYARQNLFNGWKTSAFVKETDARIKAAAYEVLNVANSAYLTTAEAYINVVKAAKLLEIAKQNALTQEKIMRQVREKTNAGFNRVSELYNSESRLALSKGSYISRQQDLNQALAVFHRQYGRFLAPEQFVTPAPEYLVPSSLEETVEKAFAHHPALMVAEHNIETRRYTYEKSSAAYWPTLDLELQGQYRNDTGGEEGDTAQAGAYLTFNYTFYDGGLRSGIRARDRQSIRKEHQRAYIERRNVNQTVRLAWNIMEAEQNKQEYLTEHVLLSAKTLDAFKEEYYVGRRTLLDLLNMENEYTDAKISEADSHYSNLTAVYRIMQATGELLDEHETGLRQLVNLPKNQKDEIDDEVYEDLDLNRDQDNMVDTLDQCDNTVKDPTTNLYGCADTPPAVLVGYPHTDDSEFSPYIIPEAAAPVPSNDGMDGSEQLEQNRFTDDIDSLISALTLEAKPNSDFVTEDAKNQLAVYTSSLLLHPQVSIVIEGHVASDNDTQENLDLSKRRAEIVKEFMMARGIPEHRISVIGKGGREPLISNSTSAGRKQNRRIEIRIDNS